MLRVDPVQAAGSSGPGGGFVLYLEGPGDCAILDAWCRRLLPSLARRLSRASVILGGRRPARAIEHFRALGGAEAGARGLCVLDRDNGFGPPLPETNEPGLEFFTWGRRHIESYLLVPDAICRGLRLPAANGRIHRVLREHLPPEDDEEAYRALDAKRILGPGGALSLALGVPIPRARVARATRVSELHEDVHGFFERLRREFGVPDTAPRVRGRIR
jgi:hypothetical protein